MKETSPISRDPEIKKEVIEVIKILKELRKAISRNADHCNKELETIKRSQSKLDSSIAEIKNQTRSNEQQTK